jgi:hypothetical protein
MGWARWARPRGWRCKDLIEPDYIRESVRVLIVAASFVKELLKIRIFAASRQILLEIRFRRR